MSYPNYPIIGVKGVARSGKDTVAAMLAEHLNGVLVAQADPMKRFAQDVFEFDEDQLWGGARKEALDVRIDELAYRQRIRSNFEFQSLQHLVDWGLLGDDEEAPRNTQEYRLLRDWFQGFLTDGKNFSPRVVLQTLGTEFGRNVSLEMWSDYALDTAEQLLEGGYGYTRTDGLVIARDVPPPAWVLITDVRFRNEALNIKARGGWLLEVQNPELNGTLTAQVGIAGHASETQVALIPRTWNNITFSNDKRLGLDAARVKAARVAHEVFGV